MTWFTLLRIFGGLGLECLDVGSREVEWFLNKLKERPNILKEGGGEPYYPCAAGIFYHYGKGVEKDEQKAQEYFRVTIKKVSPLSQSYSLAYSVAYYHLQEFDDAYHHLRQNLRPALDVWAGHLWKEGLHDQAKTYNYKAYEAFDLFESAVKRSSGASFAPAFYNLGLMYRDGEAVEQDDVKAFSYFQKASDLQYGEALYTLGWMYQEGRGVPKDMFKAHQLFKEGKKRNAHDAIYSLGRMYELGLGIKKI